MPADWLTFQSFQRSQEVLKAINTLSIHLKLTLSGVVDHEERSQAADLSVETLRAFLDKLETAADQADRPGQIERMEPAMVLGVDPRFQQFVCHYLTARHRHRFRSRLFTDSIGDTKTLLDSRSSSDQSALVECLADLRVLVEEHMDADVCEVLGTI